MMTAFVAHGVTLALTWFLLANAFVSALIVVIGPRLVARDRIQRSAAALFALRMAPVALSVVFVAALFVPSYMRFEPRDSVEGFDLTLTMSATAALVMTAIGGVRGFLAWRGAALRTRAWLQRARPLDVESFGVPTFALDRPAPLMALAGIARPRVFVSTPLLAALTAEELSATIAHEISHWRAADNLKRLVMRMSPDFLARTAVARTIERHWAAAAERAADEFGAGADASTRCALASALVKVARLVPRAAPVLDPISTLVGGGELASRVQQLLDGPVADRRAGVRPAIAAAGAAIAIAALSYPPLLRIVHDLTEILVNTLP